MIQGGDLVSTGFLNLGKHAVLREHVNPPHNALTGEPELRLAA